MFFHVPSARSAPPSMLPSQGSTLQLSKPSSLYPLSHRGLQCYRLFIPRVFFSHVGPIGYYALLISVLFPIVQPEYFLSKTDAIVSQTGPLPQLPTHLIKSKLFHLASHTLPSLQIRTSAILSHTHIFHFL